MIKALVAGALLGLIVVSPAYATHSIPAPRWWWDLNDNRNPDPNDHIIGYQRVGGNWDLEKITDFQWAAAVWSSGTRWDPFSASDHGGTMRASFGVDGAQLWCGNWVSVEYAATCTRKIARKDGTIVDFYDIYDTDTGTNTAAYNWNYGSDSPADTPTYVEIDFRGTAVHEIGHGIFLDDVSSCLSPVVTMCGNVAPGLPTKDLRTLTTDDINAANSVYPN